jgi:hypothetical protein
MGFVDCAPELTVDPFVEQKGFSDFIQRSLSRGLCTAPQRIGFIGPGKALASFTKNGCGTGVFRRGPTFEIGKKRNGARALRIHVAYYATDSPN